MTADSCTTYQIPAVQNHDGYKRAVYIIFEKDGSYYYSYEAKIKSKDIFQQ